MMKRLILPIALIGAFCAAPAQASEELAKKYACTACHAVDKKLLGPSYKDVAKKYAADKDAQAKLEDKVKKGGTGVWGQIPMPPNSTVPAADVSALVKWVLSLK
jgi:cytochrome c